MKVSVPHAAKLKAMSLVALAATSLSLAGCGFQLQGLGSHSAPTVPELEFNIANDTPQNVVAQQIHSNFQQAGTRIVANAPIQLNVGDATFNETNLNYTGDGGTQQRLVVLDVPYSIQRTSDNAYLADQQNIEVSGNYTTSTNQLLQRGDVRAQLHKQLAQQAAIQLVARVEALATHSQGQSGKAQAHTTQSEMPTSSEHTRQP